MANKNSKAKAVAIRKARDEENPATPRFGKTVNSSAERKARGKKPWAGQRPRG